MILTKHFTLAEFTASQTAARRNIDNTPPAALIPALARTARGLERIRAQVGGPIIITSGYRCPDLNAAIGGALTSQHVLGQAADIRHPGMTPGELASALDAVRTQIAFDQLILEYPNSAGGWVHVSFSPAKPRHIALTRVPGEYLRGIHA